MMLNSISPLAALPVTAAGGGTVVEFIGLSADTGAINYRTHLVLNPDSPAYFRIIVK